MIELFELAGSNPENRFSPYCWRIRLALAHKGLEPVCVPWRFHEMDRLPGAPQNRTVPVLVDEGEVIGGSDAIARHLEDRYPNGPSLFGGPGGGEAHARFIVAWADRVLMRALFPLLAPDILPLLHEADRGYFRQTRERGLGMTLEEARGRRDEYQAALHKVLSPLQAALDGQAFLGGEEPSYADYAVFSGFQWARCVTPREVMPEDEVLRAWRRSMTDLFDGLAERTGFETAHAA